MKRVKSRLSYSAGVVAIVGLVVSAFICIVSIYCVLSYNRGLDNKINDLETSINTMLNTNSDLSRQDISEKFDNEVNKMQDQYNLFISNITIILSIFGFVITICTVLMPLFTYNFLQKDQIELFHEKINGEIDTMRDKVSEMQQAFRAETDKSSLQIAEMDKVVVNFQRWLDDFFDPFEFEDVKIEPIYNISQEEIDDYYRKAIMSYSFGKTEKALNIIESVLLTNPKNTKILMAKAQIYSAVQDYQASIDALNRLLLIDNNNERYYYIRGCVAFKAKKYPEAIKDFEIACYKDPNNEIYLVKMAAALHKARRTEEAIEYQTRAIVLNTNNAQYYADRGIMYHALKKYDFALTDKGHAIKLAPDNAQYYGIYAATLYKIGSYLESVRYADTAIAKDDKLAFVYSFRGLAKSKILNGGYTEESIEQDLNQAIAIDPGNYRNFYRRAEFFISKNTNLNLVLEDLEAAGNVDPEDPEILKLLTLVYKNSENVKVKSRCKKLAEKLGHSLTDDEI